MEDNHTGMRGMKDINIRRFSHYEERYGGQPNLMERYERHTHWKERYYGHIH